MTNQPNEAAQRYSPCREKSETLVGGVVTTMKPNDQGNWVRYSLLRKAEAEITSLRSALANAEKERDEATECLRLTRGELDTIKNTPQANEGTNICGHNRYWLSGYGRCMACERDQVLSKLAGAERDCAGYKDRIHELSDELGACEKEREEALAKLAEAENDRKHVFDLCAAAEKARDHNRECIRRLVEERDAAIRQRDHAEVMKYPVENERICELEAERDALAAQLAEARGLFPLPGEPAAAAEILDGVIDFFESLRDPGPCHRDHHGGCQEHGYLGLSPTEKCPMEEIPERLEWLRGHQKWLRDVAAFLAPPSDRGAEGEK